jgi:hypothetical protein
MKMLFQFFEKNQYFFFFSAPTLVTPEANRPVQAS